MNSSGVPVKIRGDANNQWRELSDVIAYLDRLGQPFWRSNNHLPRATLQDCQKLLCKQASKIILDESCTRARDLRDIENTHDLWL